MPTPCVILLVRNDRKIEPILAERDELGEVHAKALNLTWVPQGTDWGTYEYGTGKAKRFYPALVVYETHTEPVNLTRDPTNPKKPAERLQHPAVLDTFLKGDYLGKLTRATRTDKTTPFGDFLSRIPRWAWFVALAVLAIAITVMRGSGIDLGGWLNGLK